METGATSRDDTVDRAGARAPHLALAGFSGPLDRLLTLARAQKINLADIAITTLVDQLVVALRQAPPTIALGEKADWVVMTAWLVQLRSLLLLPQQTPARQAAEAEAGQLRDRLGALQALQALAAWLDARPQNGRDVFARGRPEFLGVSVAPRSELDMIEFLWASLTLFDDDLAAADTTARYRPPLMDLFSVSDARSRILRLLAAAPDGQALDQLLPALIPSHPVLHRRSAWSSTLVASLELARLGDVVLRQDGDFRPIHVASAPASG
jgi:segregation and condensation protein A